MPAFTAAAPGKIILFGEHAVVYGRPAIAVPVTQVRARAVVEPNITGMQGEVRILAPDIGLEARLEELPASHPLAVAVQAVCSEVKVSRIPACRVKIVSTIPVASGMGSGAAVSVALIRALAAFLGRPLADERVSALAFEVEKIHHGTPSGIDNTVITYAMPVYFLRGQPPERFRVVRPFTIVIGDTGIASPTSVTVGEVRRGWQDDPEKYEGYFDRIRVVVESARKEIDGGTVQALGSLMRENQIILRQLGVSSSELERLIAAAEAAGAFGAKLSGAGRGGNMIALVEPGHAEQVAQALVEAGARRTIITQVE